MNLMIRFSPLMCALSACLPVCVCVSLTMQTKAASLLSAWDKKDYQTMRGDAYSLKGSSSWQHPGLAYVMSSTRRSLRYATADHLQRTCEAIFWAVQRNQLDSLPQLIDDFRTFSTEAKDELDKITAG